MKQFFRLVHDVARQRAIQAIKEAPAGWDVHISEPKKSRDQEEKYHAMIGDIAKQCEFLGRRWSAEDWKRLLVDDFVEEMRGFAKTNGEPDPFADQGHVSPSLDGKRIVQLGVQTRKFKKRTASDFIEFLYHFGCDRLVTWSDSSLAAYQDVRRAA